MLALLFSFVLASAHAFDALDDISADDENFIPALIEAQKKHYKHQEWDRFFANAIFYRYQKLNTLDQLKNNFKGRLIAMEVMALAKHCQWEEANTVLLPAMEIAKKIQSDDFSELEKEFVLLPAVKYFPHIQKKTTEAKIPESIFSSTQFWPIQSSSLQYVSHPKWIRVKVQNLCKN
jgi:hypothetical protein